MISLFFARSQFSLITRRSSGQICPPQLIVFGEAGASGRLGFRLCPTTLRTRPRAWQRTGLWAATSDPGPRHHRKSPIPEDGSDNSSEAIAKSLTSSRICVRNSRSRYAKGKHQHTSRVQWLFGFAQADQKHMICACRSIAPEPVQFTCVTRSRLVCGRAAKDVADTGTSLSFRFASHS